MNNRLLHAVCILIFVNHDEFELAAISGDNFGRGVENFQRKVFHVREVDDVAFTFCGGKFFGKGFRHAHELTNRRGKFANIGKHFIFIGKEKFFAQIFKSVLVIVAQSFNRRLDVRVAVARVILFEVNRKNFIVKRVPIVERSFQRVKLFGVCVKGFDCNLIDGGKTLSFGAVVENFF